MDEVSGPSTSDGDFDLLRIISQPDALVVLMLLEFLATGKE